MTFGFFQGFGAPDGRASGEELLAGDIFIVPCGLADRRRGDRRRSSVNRADAEFFVGEGPDYRRCSRYPADGDCSGAIAKSLLVALRASTHPSSQSALRSTMSEGRRLRTLSAGGDIPASVACRLRWCPRAQRSVEFPPSGRDMVEHGDSRYTESVRKFAETGDSSDLYPGIGFGRRRDRLVSEILGMFRMSLHDGLVSESEAQAMHEWIAANPDTAFVYPVKQLKDRLDRAFADGHLDATEQEELQRFAAAFQPDVEVHHPTPAATKLPLDQPAPLLTFRDQQYVFTGTFLSGTRKWCEEQVRSRGGICKAKVVQTMNFLVIGELASHHWTQSTHGRKIEEAMRLKTSGLQIAVIDEAHFVSHLG
jgi:hypothetical protein